jgi:hypothetical protein
MKSFLEFNESNDNLEQELYEVLSKDAEAGDWIDDFIKSDNPKFAGKSKKERIKMALGAYYGQQNEESANGQHKFTSHKAFVRAANKIGASLKHDDGGSTAIHKNVAVGEYDHEQKRGWLYAPNHTKNQLKEENFELDESEYIEEKSDQARANKTMKNMMDASRGARWKAQNNMTGDAVRDWDGKHKTSQAQNKAIGRALRNEEDELEESSVYDPITKKKVARKPIKAQAGGTVTKNGKPVEVGVSKYWSQKQQNEEFELDEDADFIQQHLADRDINSSVQGKTVKVHKSNVAATKRHLTKAGYKDHKVVSGLNEEIDQIDELDKKTLGNYVKKANDQLTKHKVTTATKFARGDKDALSYSLDDTAVRKTANRTKGVDRAINKLTKEDIEQIDEISKDTLTSYAHKSFAAGNELHKQIEKETDPAKKAELRAKLSKRNTGVIKAAQKVKEENSMLTYAEFMEKIQESKLDDLRDRQAAEREKRLSNYDYSKEKEAPKSNVTKHYAKHSSEYDDEDDNEKKPVQSDVKRGRGRPKGTTGAYKRK